MELSSEKETNAKRIAEIMGNLGVVSPGHLGADGSLDPANVEAELRNKVANVAVLPLYGGESRITEGLEKLCGLYPDRRKFILKTAGKVTALKKYIPSPPQT